MSRLVRNWELIDVATAEVAPYVEDTCHEALSFKEARERVPYKKGDVIWVERYMAIGNGQWGHKAVRARISNAFVERDPMGDFRPFYSVQYETAAGYFAKTWARRWPGHVERGYELAGAA